MLLLRRLTILLLWLAALPLQAAPHAAIVMDARDGTVYMAENPDIALHPASLTKMMTLYLAFEALSDGTAQGTQPVVVSSNAAAKGGARMGLDAGDRVTLDTLLRATAIRSANDAATALAEALAGSEQAFVIRMNETARRLGMTGTTFRNPHGLTEDGHRSTARDMAQLGRALARDHPGRFAIFSRREDALEGQRVQHTNRRFLNAYAGADGIKTGFTRAAGYCLTASARRDGKHLIVTVMGATDSASRAAAVSSLMDKGFALAPDDVAPERRPATSLLALRPAAGFGAGSVLAVDQPSAEDEAEADALFADTFGDGAGAVGLGGVGLAAFDG